MKYLILAAVVLIFTSCTLQAPGTYRAGVYPVRAPYNAPPNTGVYTALPIYTTPQPQTPVDTSIPSPSGFLSGESTSGMLKTCYYKSVQGAFTKTVNSVSLCPLNAGY